MSAVTAAAAASAHVSSLKAEDKATDGFRSSAIAFHSARFVSKVSAPALGKAVTAEAATKAKGKDFGDRLYTSASMIDAHALTGSVLLMTNVPEVSAKDVIQRDIRKAEKAVGMPKVKAIIGKGTDATDVLATLKAATEKAAAEKAAAKNAPKVETDETSEDAPKVDAPKVSRYVVALDLLTAASNDGEIMPEDVRAGLLAILDAARVDA